MKLSRLSTHADAPVGPPPQLMDEVRFRRARTHVIEAMRDLDDLDPTLCGVLDAVKDALDVTIDGLVAAWR